MKIPAGNLATVLPSATRTQTVNTDGGLSAAQANLAETAQRAANQFGAQAAEEQRRIQDRDEKIATVTAHANIQNGLADTLDSIADRVNKGDIDQLGAMAEWKDTQQKIIDDNSKNLPAYVQPLVQAEMAGLSGRLTNRLTDVFRANDSKVAAADRLSYGEQMERFARTDAPLAIKQYHQFIDQDPFANPEEKQKLKQTFSEKVKYTEAYSLITGARDNVRALEGLRTRLNSDEYIDIDPQKRAALDASINTRVSTLIQRNAAQAEARDRQAAAAFTSFSSFIESGRPPTPQYAVQVATQFKGTAYEGAVMSMLKDGSELAGFSSASVTKQREILLSESSKLNKAGSDPVANKRFQKLQAIHNATLADIKEDPLTASVDRNVNQTLEPISFDVNTLSQQLAKRKDAAATASAWTGKPVAPVTKGEAEQIVTMLEPLGPRETATVLKGIVGAIGPRATQALATLMGDKNGSLAIAAGLSSLNTSEGRNVAAIYLDGKQVLKDGRAKMDAAKETGTKAQIYSALQGVYPTQKATDQAAEVIYNVYASKKASGTDNLSTAIKLGTGGLIEYNGAKVALPYGKTETDLQDAVKAVTPAALKTQGSTFRVGTGAISPEQLSQQLPRLPLQTVGNGTYAVRVGGIPVLREDGTPLILNLGGSNVR